MNYKSIRKELQKYKLGEIKIAIIDCAEELNTGTAIVVLPYTNSNISIEFKGSTTKEATESLIENICCELDDMIDHLAEHISNLEQGAEE